MLLLFKVFISFSTSWRHVSADISVCRQPARRSQPKKTKWNSWWLSRLPCRGRCRCKCSVSTNTSSNMGNRRIIRISIRTSSSTLRLRSSRCGSEWSFEKCSRDIVLKQKIFSPRFQELSHGGSDEDFLKRKVQCISNTFLESVYPPALQVRNLQFFTSRKSKSTNCSFQGTESTLCFLPPINLRFPQITISNELHVRMLRLVQRYLTGKEVTASLFEEAQYVCFKEMLPYWAGFLRQWEIPADGKFRPGA